MKIKYTGTSNVRTISSKEFDLVGVKEAKALETVRDEAVEVSDEVGKYLLENEGGQWATVEDDQAPEEVSAPAEAPAEEPVAAPVDAVSTQRAKKPSAHS